jgi:acetolactate decarboxylase
MIPQTKPFPPYDEVLKSSARDFEYRDVEGTMVAFYTPIFMNNIGIPGYHFHFLTAAETGGGHVTSFTVSEGRIAVERIDHFLLSLPKGDDYGKALLTS